MRTAMVVALILATAWPAAAEVNLGRNVRIGGHDFSHQSYGPGRNAVIRLYDREPPNAGCRWLARTDGGRTKSCRLKVKRER